MARHRLDLNPEDYAVHFRTRRWSATLIIAKTLRWLAARTAKSARQSAAAPSFTSRRQRSHRPILRWVMAALRPG